VVPLSFSDLVAFTLLALLIAVPVTIILALLGIKRSIRRSRFWRYGLPICVAFVLLQLMLLFNHGDIEQAYADALRQHYTHHLSEPKVYDGLQFPAGATVVLTTWEPHTVSTGTLPVETMLLGLPVHGDFSIDVAGYDKPVRYLSEGVLSRVAEIRGVPCAAGKFSHRVDSSKDSVDCTLAADHAIGDLVLPAGTRASLAFDVDRPGDVEVFGDAPRDWSALGVQCAKGEFDYYGGPKCILARNQLVAGYPLAAGQEASIYRTRHGELAVTKGVLAENFEVAGVRVPVGSTIEATYNGDGIDADRLRHHDLGEGEYVGFELPKGARMELAGSVLEGDFISLSVRASSISAHVVVDPEGEHTIIRDGEFDLATRQWNWKTYDD